MTVKELMELLEEQDPEAEVRLMEQPNWPFEYSLGNRIYDPSDRPCSECNLDRDDPVHDPSNLAFDYHSFEGFRPVQDSWSTAPADHPVVYLVEGQQLAYGDRDAWGY